MKETIKLRYPTTAEIVEFVYNRDHLKVTCYGLSDKISKILNPGYKGPDIDDDTWWGATCELKKTFDKREKLISVPPEDLPALIKKEVGVFDDEDYENTVVDLVEYHWYHFKEVYDILPDKSLPQDSDHCLTAKMKKEIGELEQKEKNLRSQLDRLENRPDIDMAYIHDYDIQTIEKKIIRKYEDTRLDYSVYECLLSLRKEMINKRVLAHQEDILCDIIAFNETITDALHEMYEKAYRIWNYIKDNKVFGGDVRLTARCYLDDKYPKQHPIQGDDRQDLWNALCDTAWNRLYIDGVTISPLTCPDNDNFFMNLIGKGDKLQNWNEGLDSEMTKDLHLTSAFHHLFEHTYFAITDFIYIREFKTEIKIDINPNFGGRGFIFEKARLNKYDGPESPFPSDQYKVWVEAEESLVSPPNILVACLKEGWHIKVGVEYV